ncbi:tripartite tricarboxylate transporter permease [Acidovorax sp. HDW3]|uniref:tripartite tricarboxylate transporter permease n=1 Tax=Acidovorax sp. HDW3 TaxID=2714923 RepID=UPI0014099170|nr:tripartite tricarboxylate transporter permease [Acidovorax sp. HDW3]QIL43396.1 tripartite tricarboxylate transporter permease [Acidovorax sp. HDW3]
MEWLAHGALGLEVLFSSGNVLAAVAGCLLGLAVGVLPGLGPMASIAMLLPVTYALAPPTALIFLAGIYYGAQYGGAVPAILRQLPGEASSAVTVRDGYAMARAGQAGAALGAAALASFVAGTVGTLLLAALAPLLSAQAQQVLQAPEQVALLVLLLVGAVVLASGALLKALGMVLVGLLLGLVGMDPYSGQLRYDLGLPELAGGISFMALAMGLFGLGEIIAHLGRKPAEPALAVQAPALAQRWPDALQRRQLRPALLRGTVLGSLLGWLPGGGALLASFAAYAVEGLRRLRPGELPLGQGNIRGVAAPEAANSAGAQAAFMPLLALGLPTNAVMALLLGALSLHQVQPGPLVPSQAPQLFWGLILSMGLGNLVLLLCGLPLLGLWLRVLALPYRLLFPALVLLCALGMYSLQASSFSVALLCLCALLGYVFRQLGMEPGPLLLGFIVAPQLEAQLRLALVQGQGTWSVFWTRPLAAGLLVLTGLLLLLVLLPGLQRQRGQTFVDD